MERLTSLLIALVAAGSLGAAAFSLASRDHPPTPPLDDAYIYLQYARTATDGHPGAYFPGEPRSTGATSVLWFAALTATAAIVRLVHTPDAVALPTALFVLNTLAVALQLGLANRLARRHRVGTVAAWFPAALCALTPLWFFGSWNGMETGLYGAALLGGAVTLAGGSVLWLAFLALARPEGTALALGILAWRWIRRRATTKSGADTNPEPGAPSPLAAATVILAATLMVSLPWILTGASSSAWTAKALWTEPDPAVRSLALSRLPTAAARALAFGLTGARVQPAAGALADLIRPASWAAWAWIVFLGGGVGLAFLRRRSRGPVLLWIAATLLALDAITWNAQLYRYLVPGFTLLITAAVGGWFGTSSPAPSGRGLALARSRFAAGMLAVLAVVAAAFAVPGGFRTSTRWLYRGECERMEGTQVQVGRWIHDHLPPGTRVATHDVGAIAFVGERPVVDLVGLVTPALSGDYREGEGAIWEALDRLPPEARPAYAAVIPAWMPYLAGTDWARKRVWALDPGSSQRPSQSFEIRELSWPGSDPALWPGGDFGNRPREHGAAAGRPDWTVVDAMDVADLDSEAAHRMRPLHPPGPTLVRNLGFVERGSPAMDGGREMTVPATFVLHAERDRAARLVARTASAREVAVVVRIADWTDTLHVPRDESRFREPSVTIPEGVVHAAIGRDLEIQVDAAGARIFHWWLLQPKLPGD